MTRRRRRNLLPNLALGAILTLLVIVLHLAGALQRPENWLYDLRCRYCQGNVQPTDRLMQMDIDDESIAAIGRWPWSRSVLASIVDELHRARAATIGIDVLLADREQGAAIDRDAELAAAMQRAGNVVLPAAFVFGKPSESPGQATLVKLLSERLETSREEADEQMAAAHLPRPSPDEYLTALHEAASRRIAEAGFPQVPARQIRKVLLPRSGQVLISTVASHVVDEELERAQALAALGRFGRPVPSGAPAAIPCRGEIPPLAEFSDAARGCGFVDFLVSSDGVVRRVPLWIQDRGLLIPQFGLALTCAYLGVRPADLIIEPGALILPRPDGSRMRIPVSSVTSAEWGKTGYFMDVPFFGGADWLTSYDAPHFQHVKQHLNVTVAWEAVQTLQRLRSNNRQLDDAIGFMLAFKSPEQAEAYKRQPHDTEDLAGRSRLISDLLRDSFIRATIEDYARQTPEQVQQRDQNDARFLAAKDALLKIPTENQALADQLGTLRGTLRDAVGGRVVLMGSAATAAPDMRTTPLHAQCPGFVIHGVIFNALLTGLTWRPAPQWANVGCIVLAGLLTTLLVAFLPTWAALVGMVALEAGFVALDGYVLFGHGHWIVSAAGPVFVGVGLWAILTVLQLMLVSAERAYVVRRFRYYVDPALVNYVIEHPERIHLDGEVREMSVVVTALENFGGITDLLRERTVELLNQYMNIMVPLIRSRGGYVNKFLGGGVMFFFGAPVTRPDHAACAVETALQMQEETARFNERFTRRGMPAVRLRVGISSGPMIVGDAGADSGGDYTVLGEPVNFCFHLEEANKLFGTRILISEQTLGRLGDRYLARPVTRLRATGAQKQVMVYEPLCIAADASASQRRLAELSTDVVALYLARKLAECLRAVDRLEEELGESPFTDAYRRLCTARSGTGLDEPEGIAIGLV